MPATLQPAGPMIAADLMSRDVVTVLQHLPAADAAQVLLSKAISGLPVVDDEGRCVGVFSASDVARMAQTDAGPSPPPVPCPFQLRHRMVAGNDVTLCTLPQGICALQRSEEEEGRTRHVCSYPHEILVEWSTLQPACSPTDPVRRWMTAEPITVSSDATISECAARMLQARIHRLVVIDDEQRVVGILSNTDVLKAVAGAPNSKSSDRVEPK